MFKKGIPSSSNNGWFQGQWDWWLGFKKVLLSQLGHPHLLLQWSNVEAQTAQSV